MKRNKTKLRDIKRETIAYLEHLKNIYDYKTYRLKNSVMDIRRKIYVCETERLLEQENIESVKRRIERITNE